MPEAAEVAIARMEQEISSHNDRIKSLHGRVGEVQVKQGNQEADLKVIKREVEETKEDFKEFRTTFKETTDEIRTEFNNKFATLTGAVRWGTGTMIALIGVLLTILLQGH